MGQKIPGLNDALKASEVMNGLEKHGLKILWQNMSTTEKKNLKKKNYVISYKNERIDGSGFHVLEEPPLKVTYGIFLLIVLTIVRKSHCKIILLNFIFYVSGLPSFLGST